MLKSVIFLIAISFSMAFEFRSFQTDKSRRPGEVISLTASEFVRFVKENPLIAMVANFFSPNCRHSQALEPQLEKAAMMMKSSFPHLPIQFVKINGKKEHSLVDKYDDYIPGWPTILLIIKDRVFQYNEANTAGGIVDFVRGLVSKWFRNH